MLLTCRRALAGCVRQCALPSPPLRCGESSGTRVQWQVGLERVSYATPVRGSTEPMSRRKVRRRASCEEFATAPRQLLKLAIVILGRLDGRTAIVGTGLLELGFRTIEQCHHHRPPSSSLSSDRRVGAHESKRSQRPARWRRHHRDDAGHPLVDHRCPNRSEIAPTRRPWLIGFTDAGRPFEAFIADENCVTHARLGLATVLCAGCSGRLDERRDADGDVRE
jgi:hypothetical protein